MTSTEQAMRCAQYKVGFAALTDHVSYASMQLCSNKKTDWRIKLELDEQS